MEAVGLPGQQRGVTRCTAAISHVPHYPSIPVITLCTEVVKSVLTCSLSVHPPGQWAFPGGHLEFGESIVACAERETLEETGLHVKGVKIAGVTNSVFTDTQLHYVTLFVQCEPCDPSQELQPQAMEPDKCEGWTWKSWADIKRMADEDVEAERLFLPIINLVHEHPNFGQGNL
ncbi:hypothetical protein RB601_006075 [Gaeumannomyces tritici]